MIEKANSMKRAKITAEDKARYTGIVRHPMARKWMLRRLAESSEKALSATTDSEELRWKTENKRVAIELNRCGVKLEAFS